MRKFKRYDYVEIIATGHIGTIIDIDGRFYEVESCLTDGYDTYLEKYKASELRPAEPVHPDAVQLKALIRCELSVYELTEGKKYLGDPAEENDYKLCVEDIYAGFMSFMEADLCRKNVRNSFGQWVETILQCRELKCYGEYRWDITDSVSVQDLLNEAIDMLNELSDMFWDDWSDDEIHKETGEFKRFLEECMKNGNGSGTVEDIPERIMEKIAGQYDDDSIDGQSEATQELFRKCLDSLCEKKIPWAIQKRGYCYYCGTKIYPNDWIKARDAFLEYYDLSGDASAANTLGYIFYYGRCTDGVPEYEKAFRFFSIGHAFGYFESTYKLADMFAHGYGVKKSGVTALRMYEKVYDENRKRFIKGDLTCKFADAALRMGNCARDGIGMEKNPAVAYTYFLEADLAIRERIKAANHYGDNVVYSGVQKALAEAREAFKGHRRYILYKYPAWEDLVLIKHRSCRCSVKKMKNDSYTLTFQPLPYAGESEAPKILQADPYADFCEFNSKLKVRTASGSKLEVADGTDSFVFNYQRYDWSTDTACLYMDEKLVARITTQKYSYIHHRKKIAAPSGEKHHFVSIVFGANGRTYDYLCKDASVKAGDRVIVNGYNGETEVEVVGVFDQYESELGLPLERYKEVVRKA